VILVDANLLLYAYHPRAAQHDAARRWLEETLSGSDPVAFSWPTILAFLRIGTNHHVFERPLDMKEACAIVSSWLTLPTVTVLSPGEEHWKILERVLTSAQIAGPLVSDAALAALAMEHGATLATTDRDFARFGGLRTINPLS
jgi:toxin-antitoxin system PIN domain toxin